MYQIPVSCHSLEWYSQCNIFTFAVGKKVPYYFYNFKITVHYFASANHSAVGKRSQNDSVYDYM